MSYVLCSTGTYFPDLQTYIGGTEVLKIVAEGDLRHLSWADTLQVARDFDGGIVQKVEEGASKQIVDTEIAMRRKRQACFLQRQPDSSWRPQKKFRVAAKNFLLQVDNCLSVSTDDWSLSKVCLPERVEERGAALSWPKFHLASDLDSTGIAAVNWVVRMRNGNIQRQPDPSHGCHNNLNEAVREAGLAPVQRLLLLSRNLESGPFKEDVRYNQLYESWQETWRHTSCADSPVFQDLVGRILADRGESSRLGEPNMSEVLWRELGEYPVYRTKTGETNAGRFLTSFRESLGFKQSYHIRLYSQLCLCLEMDWLRAAHLAPLLEQLEASASSGGPDEPGAAMRKSAGRWRWRCARARRTPWWRAQCGC